MVPAKVHDKKAADGDEAVLIALASILRAVDSSGATARRAAVLVRLASSMSDISESERRRLASIAVLFEGISR